MKHIQYDIDEPKLQAILDSACETTDELGQVIGLTGRSVQTLKKRPRKMTIDQYLKLATLKGFDPSKLILTSKGKGRKTPAAA